jgi:hypothetical protein
MATSSTTTRPRSAWRASATWSLRRNRLPHPARDLHDLLDAQPRLSIAQALSQREAPQGLGSVIGYLSLGTRFGNVVAGEQELAEWRGGDGQVRRARIPLVWFTQERRHELA